MELAVMIEGQDGLTWPRWQRLAIAIEDLGFVGLYRSDHYTNADPPDKDSLELWVSLTWLASHTKRIEFGPMVTPFSFRQPTMTVRMAIAVDDLSGGRLTLGIGGGWQEREHTNYGWDLLDIKERFDRFEEGTEIVNRLLKNDQPIDFNGKYYRLEDAVSLPRPQRPNGPPILIGGNGPKRTLPLVARYADEWNGVFITAAKYSELNTRLDNLLAENNRPKEAVRRSLMTNIVFGRNDAELNSKLQGQDRAELQARGIIVGTPSSVVEQLGTLAQSGIQRIMLQWLEQDDLDGLEALAKTVMPQVS